ncbi:hypothetical protein C4D60_Mb10t18410 [Musa balbisiana]|uniref:Uncharacterized protein n=1 Tax=Musa balbisiana TaxID=52838 RepID=A0A4V4H4X1_MUSBA|nr:hypothetical protein C4D60_Mb10t18410 [Musa balbisiana]
MEGERIASKHSVTSGQSTGTHLPTYAIFNTAKGSMTIELYKDASRDVEIEEVDTDEHYRPKSPVGIVDIALKQEA